jgi:hypothetical protein
MNNIMQIDVVLLDYTVKGAKVSGSTTVGGSMLTLERGGCH